MTVEYTFVPQAVGDFKIGSDKFVYFNLAKHQYETLTTPSYNIKVSKGISSESTIERKDIESKNTDILFIKTGQKNLSETHTLVIDTWWYWFIYLMLAFGLVALLTINRHRMKQASDLRGMRLAKASKVAKRRLKVAREFMDKKDSDKFYEELLKAVWGYLSDKLSIPVSQLSRDNVASELRDYGASEPLCNDFIDVLDESEMARYTPSASQEKIEKLYDRATESINELERTKPLKNLK